MKASLGALLCLAAAACSHDKPASSAYDSSARAESGAADEQDPVLTPAAGSDLERRQNTAADTPPHHRPASVPPAGADRGNKPNESAPASDAPAPERDDPEPRGDAARDNTRVNERDRNDAALTPPDQQENQTDLKITQQIRKAVMADDSLSFTAKNVKIITAGGKVTLRGPVNSDAERSAIEAAARKIAGVKQVDNQLEVKR
jgi:hyperosmotically inducible periplasmic protein